ASRGSYIEAGIELPTEPAPAQLAQNIQVDPSAKEQERRSSRSTPQIACSPGTVLAGARLPAKHCPAAARIQVLNSPLQFLEINMASSRQDDKSTHTTRNAVREIGESTAEQTKRMGEAAAEAGQKVAQVGADLFQQNADMFQNALRFGPDLAAAVMRRSTDQLSRALGLSSDDVQQTTERSTRSAATMLHSTSAVAKSM